MKYFRTAAATLVATWLVSCGGETEQEKAQKDEAADINASSVTSCGWEDMEKQRLNFLSHIDEAEICSSMLSTLGRLPSVALARKLSKAIYVMRVNGSTDKPKELAYQIMGVLEARGQLQNDAAMDSSIETIFKIFSGSQGHVTPRDINVMVRSSGPLATTLSDDGIMGLAAVLWEDKKANGE